MKWQYIELNDKVFEWFCSAKSKNLPDVGSLLQEIALMLAKELGRNGFAASRGRLESFNKSNITEF